MILYQWRGQVRNFGDELNSLLWPRLLPGFFDDDPSVRFLGIGSILDGRHNGVRTKLVAGSGYGGYEAPATLDPSWIVHWVRGPRTAHLLGLPPSLGLGDPGCLVPLAGMAPVRQPRDIGFMPHFESAARGAWREACDAAGMRLIDPREDPMTILAALAECRVLISEALHGIIVADALRVPWIAVRPLAPIHRPKWDDWAESLGLTIAFHDLSPSSALERAHLTPLSQFHLGRRVLTHQAARLHNVAPHRFIARAAKALRAAAGADPSLSRDTVLAQRQGRMMEAIGQLARAPLNAWQTNGRSAVPDAHDPVPRPPARQQLAV